MNSARILHPQADFYRNDPIVREFAWESQHAEPLTAGISGAWVDFLATPAHYEWYRASVDQRIHGPKPFTPGHATRLSKYLCHSFLLEKDSHPTHYPSRPEWRDFLQGIHDDDDTNLEFRVRHAVYDPVTSKIPRGYAVVLALGLYYPNEHEYRLADLGCSRNEMLSFLDLLTLGELERRDYMPGFPTLEKGSVSERIAFRNLLLSFRNKIIDESYGFDFYGLNEDFIERVWYPACNQPKVLIDSAQRRGRYILRANRDNNPDIKFVRSDVARERIRDIEPDPIRNHERFELPSAKYEAHFAVASFLHYMLSPEDRMQTEENAADLAHMSAVLDAMKVEPNGRLKFAKSWKHWSTTLAVRKRDDPLDVYTAEASFKEGDCMKVQPIKGGMLAKFLAKAT